MFGIKHLEKNISDVIVSLIFIDMKVIISERQLNLLSELAPSSYGVEDFFEMVQDNKGLLQYLGFDRMKDLKEYVYENDNKEFNKLKQEAKEFLEKKNKK